MRIQAFLLNQTTVGSAAEVARDVATVPGVTGADAGTGPYDVIALAEARTIDEPGKMVVARVQAIPGVSRTLTCPVVHLRPALAYTSILFLAAGRPQALRRALLSGV